MTERNDTDETDGTNGTGERERTTMRDVDHTHPYDDTSAGELFLRGPVVAADGGEREAGTEREDEEPDDRTMKDVDHTPPVEGEGANRVFERGEEHGTEPVVGEE
jgi:hypothetical protein